MESVLLLYALHTTKNWNVSTNQLQHRILLTQWRNFHEDEEESVQSSQNQDEPVRSYLLLRQSLSTDNRFLSKYP